MLCKKWDWVKKVLAILCWCYDLHHLLVHFCLTVCLQCMAALVCIVNSRFSTGQQAANFTILFVARSADLGGKRWIRCLFWYANWPPRSVHFFPTPRRSKSETSTCRYLREMGGGVDDLHCCATHSWGVLKPGNSWSQQSVHHFIRGRQDEQLDSRWDPGDAASPQSLELSSLSACCSNDKLLTVAAFKLKAPC